MVKVAEGHSVVRCHLISSCLKLSSACYYIYLLCFDYWPTMQKTLASLSLEDMVTLIIPYKPAQTLFSSKHMF